MVSVMFRHQRSRMEDATVEVSKHELSEAITYLRDQGKPQMTFPYWNPILLAERLLGYVKEHKEPEWECGDIVRSSDGKFYKRTASRQWMRFGLNAAWGHDQPKRPLTMIGNEKFF